MERTMVVSAIPRNKNVRLLVVRFFWILLLLLPVVVCWVVPPTIVTHTLQPLLPTTTIRGYPTTVAWNIHGCSRNDVMIQRSANRNFGSRRMETVLVLHMGMDNNDSDDPNSSSAADDDDEGPPLLPTTTTITTTDDGSRDDDDILSPESNDYRRRNLTINLIAAALLVASGTASSQLFLTSVYTPTGFRRVSPIQFIAALGDPKAASGSFHPRSSSSSSSSAWGIWKQDPGPRGVWLRDYPTVFLESQPVPPSLAPAGWTFNANDWWLEEHGIIMESPIFPIPPGRYLVTGGRSLTTGLTIDNDGNWMLDEGTLYDVTHLPCRSARYRPLPGVEASPKQANLKDFPVRPGAAMPTVPGYSKQDYAVLFLVGVANGL